MPQLKSSPKTHRREILYWVCCDCRDCRAETGRPFMSLGFGYDTEGEAIQALEAHAREHPSCYIAREIMEPLEAPKADKAQGKPRKRKAA